MGFSDRTAAVRMLWAAVRKLGDHGEEALRAAVERLNVEDATNLQRIGTPEFRSTKFLSREQLSRLATEFRKKAQLPAPNPRMRGPKGGRARRPEAIAEPGQVSYILSRAEADYIEYLFDLLNFSDESQAAFIERQTKKKGLTTHAAATAVTAPLERMLRAKGYVMRCLDGRTKTWTTAE